MTDSKFPSCGQSWPGLKREMEKARTRDLPVHHERLFRPAYFAGDDVLAVASQAFQLHIEENALYAAMSYPALRQYETELVDMLLELFRAPKRAGGNVTSGGTESNMMAVKTARDWARTQLPRARTPEIVIPRTAHPSFAKAAHWLGLKVVRMANSVDFRADVAAMARAINHNTIMLVASAPPSSYGVVDPVGQIAALAKEHGLWMHVDACMGGLILPFVRQLDPSVPAFDLRVPGVSSISADLHKYGYAVKGVSCILFRDTRLQAHQRFVYDDPVSGYYSTPNFAGTRTGGAISAAWAVMRYLGRDGYLRTTRKLLDIKRRFIAGIEAIDGLEICGVPHALHFAVTSGEVDIYAVAERMEECGWSGRLGGEPPYMWLMLNMSHEPVVEAYLADLEEVVAEVKAGRIEGRVREAVYAR